MEFEFDYESRMRKSNKFLNSEQNKTDCMPFVERCKQFESDIKKYIGKFDELLDYANLNTSYKKYATSGEMLHRGFYCPSPTFDLVIGNCNRGKLLKNEKRAKNISFEYFFDCNDNLILIKKFDEYHECYLTEFIVKDAQQETGISFATHKEIACYSKMIYNNEKLVEYDLAVYNDYQHSIMTMDVEKYNYKNNSLYCTDMYNFITPNLLRHSRAIFSTDENGFLASYTAEDFQGETKEPSINSDHAYKITKKRKA